MPLSPTSGHHDVLNVSPRPSLSDTLHSFDAPFPRKPSPLITTPDSSYQPPSPCRSDADEQTLVGETRSFISTPTPVTPIHHNPLRNLRVPNISRHTSGVNRRNIMPHDCLVNTFAIACGTIMILGLGAVFGLCSISIGCLTKKSSMETCKKLGAAGGTFASIPATLIISLTWYIHDILHKRKALTLLWESIYMVFFAFPLICFGFAFLSAFIGWHILNSAGSVDFDLHRAFVFAAIGSASTLGFCSLTFGLLILVTLNDN